MDNIPLTITIRQNTRRSLSPNPFTNALLQIKSNPPKLTSKFGQRALIIFYPVIGMWKLITKNFK